MTQSKLELRLIDASNKDSNLIMLLSIFNIIKDHTTKYLSGIEKTFPHYSRHDLSHIQNILDNIERILGDDRINILSIGDVWLILVSVYLHDIGMLVSYQEEKDAWESESFKEFLSSCEHSIDKDLYQAAKAIRDKNGNIHPLLLRNYVTQLTAEFFRKKHTARIDNIVAGKSPISKLFSVEIPENLQNIWIFVGKIVESHGLDFDTLLTMEFDRKNFPIPTYGYYHPRLVAVLLRLGDLCDVQRGRFNEMNILQFGLLPTISAQHYYKHKTMDDPLIDHEEIKMTANISFDEIKQNIPREQYATETEREDFCAQIVHQHVNWFSMISADLADFSRHKDSIFPPDTAIRKDIPKFVHNINLNAEELQLTLENLRFNFSREKAYELIEGYSLYDDPLTFVRELIQNSLDALKMKMWQDINTENSWFAKLIQPDKLGNISALMPFDFTNPQELFAHYQIKISVKYDREQKRAKIIFGDNGIGISQEDFRNKIIQTGASWQGDKYQEYLATMPDWLRPTGSFGIGLHSVFAVVDRFRIETCSKGASQVIVLHSGRKSGFVFSRPDKRNTQNGTRVIIEVDADRITDQDIDVSPIEKHSANSVLDTLRKYINENIICPLFDIYLYDEDTAINENCAMEPIVRKLCDHNIYGKLFDPYIRNRLYDGSILSEEFIDKRYDIAIINLSPLRFFLWDREQYAFYTFKPELFGRYKSTPIEDNPPHKRITYMGIALRDQEMKSLYTISQLHILFVEFLAGNGKEDIIANRSRLKKEKLSKVRQQLESSAKAAALFGQGLFSTVIQTKIIKELIVSAEKTADYLSVNPLDVSGVFNDLKGISPVSKPTAVEQLLYIVFVYRSYMKKNRNTLWNVLSEIFNNLAPFSKNSSLMDDAFFHLWYTNQFLVCLTKLLMRLSYEFDKAFNCHTSFSFAYGFGYGFMREIGRMFEHEVGLKLNTNNLEMGHSNPLYEQTIADVLNEFGDEFIGIFCQGLRSGFSERRSVLGRAFLDKYSDLNETNQEHIGVLGNGFLDTIKAIDRSRDHFMRYSTKDTELDSIHNWLYETLFKNKSTDHCLNLLSNDNWAWVLWASIKLGLPVKNFLHNTVDYFSLLPDYGHGYYFDKCDTVADLFQSHQLTCRLKNLTNILYDKLPFLWYLRWERIEIREQEFFVQLTSTNPNDSVPIIASKSVIQKWWREMNWNLHPGFDEYADITMPHTEKFSHNKINDTEIDFPYNTPVLILPIMVGIKPRKQFVMESDNNETAVAGIMKCEQVINIIDYIFLHRLKRDNRCTKEEIKNKYTCLINDYVSALRI
jgi:hypothetical protein